MAQAALPPELLQQGLHYPYPSSTSKKLTHLHVLLVFYAAALAELPMPIPAEELGQAAVQVLALATVILNSINNKS